MLLQILSVLWFASAVIAPYAPEGAQFAVQPPVTDVALPPDCVGLATASRAGLLEEEPSVWTCATPPEGTVVVADYDLVQGASSPVLLRWDGAAWQRFTEAPRPAALTRVPVTVVTPAVPNVADPLPVIPLWYGDLQDLAPQDGDSMRARADCYITTLAPTTTPGWTAPTYWNMTYTINCMNPGAVAPYGYNYEGWCGTSQSTGFPPATSPLSGITMALDYDNWVGAPGIIVRGKREFPVTWACEITVMPSRPL